MGPAQTALAEWVGAEIRPDLFATWTFGRRWPEGPTEEAVRYHVGRWCRQHRLQGLCVVERGTSGMRRRHGHGALRCPDVYPASRSHQGLWRDWSRRYGRGTFVPISEIGGVAGYVSKYAVKGLPSADWWLE